MLLKRKPFHILIRAQKSLILWLLGKRSIKVRIESVIVDEGGQISVFFY